MLFSHVVLAFAAVAAVAALPAPSRNTAPARSGSQAARPPPRRVSAKNKKAAKKGAKMPKPKKGGRTRTPGGAVVALPSGTTDAPAASSAPAPAATNAAAVAAAVDSGIANVIEVCNDPNGISPCFEILGDLKLSCFELPAPAAGNVSFFLPPIGGVCSLFTDIDCADGQETALGAVTNVAANSWSCTSAAAAVASASAGVTTVASVSASSSSTSASSSTSTSSSATAADTNSAAAAGGKKSTPPPTKVAPKSKTPPKKGAKMPAPKKGGKTKNGNGQIVALPSGTDDLPPPPTSAAQAAAALVLDSGIANVIEGCTDPKGASPCFEILGDTKLSCFEFPSPLAGNVQFFLPPVGGVCSVFTDIACTQGQESALGVVSNTKALSWSCTTAATAIASASAGVTTVAATSVSTTASSSTSSAAATNAAASKSKPPPKKVAPKSSAPAKKGAKMPHPKKGGYTRNGNGQVVALPSGTGTLPPPPTGAALAAAIVDSGIANVIEVCTDPKGVTPCFQILGDLKLSCFEFPAPAANDVQFFLPPIGGVCSVFTDTACTQGQEDALGAVSNAKANSWSCAPVAAAVASASAGVTTVAATSVSTSATASTTSAAATNAAASKSKPPPKKVAPKSSAPAKKGAKMPHPKKGGYTRNGNGQVVALPSGTGTLPPPPTGAALAAAIVDSGIANVIEVCTDPKGVTPCFQILGDLKLSCFEFPAPAANDVQFFLPPIGGVCSVFTDTACTQGQEDALGAVSNAKANSWSCAPVAAAVASASAGVTTVAATSVSTSASTTTAAVSTNAAASKSKPPPKKVAPKSSAPAKKGAKMPHPKKGGYTRNGSGQVVALPSGTGTLPPPPTGAALAAAIVDSGIANVIEVCTDPKGVSPCFQILGDLKLSCFEFPAPAANDVQFFLPPIGGVCSVFTDTACTQGQEDALGAVSNAKANSWSCTPVAAAVASASAGVTTVAATSVSTSTTASTTAAASTNAAAATGGKKSAPPPTKVAPKSKTPPKKGAKMPAPKKGGKTKNGNGQIVALPSGTDDLPPPPTSAAQAAAAPVLDSGIANVIEGCTDPKGASPCFQILGDTKLSCFEFPSPLAGDVQFFLPPVGGVCSVFTDIACTQGQESALGVVSNTKALSWSCTTAATAIASASAGVTTAAATSTAAAAANTNAAVATNSALDSGIANVILVCEDPNGESPCFEILGDTKASCFELPNPVAGNTQFFLPPVGGVCSLFSDTDCTAGEEPAAGKVSNIKANSWSCTAAAAAA